MRFHWQDLLASDAKVIVLRDCRGPGIPSDMKVNWLRRIAGHELPDISPHESSFLLMALAVAYLQPQQHIIAAAKRFPMVPTVMAHMRRTDKAKEVRKCPVPPQHLLPVTNCSLYCSTASDHDCGVTDTEYDKHALYLPTLTFAHCLASIIEHFPDANYQRIHVMSDSDEAYAEITEYVRSVGGKIGGPRLLKGKTNSSSIHCYEKPCVDYHLTPLSQVTMTDFSSAFVELMDEKTLKRFHQGGHTKVSSTYSRRFHELVLTDVYSAALAPNFRACVTYSSNVGRFILEYAAHKHRAVQLHRSGVLGVSLDNEWEEKYCRV